MSKAVTHSVAKTDGNKRIVFWSFRNKKKLCIFCTYFFRYLYKGHSNDTWHSGDKMPRDDFYLFKTQILKLNFGIKKSCFRVRLGFKRQFLSYSYHNPMPSCLKKHWIKYGLNILENLLIINPRFILHHFLGSEPVLLDVGFEALFFLHIFWP